MSYKTARKIAKIIAILTAIALVVTSFSFMLFASGGSVVFAETTTRSAASAGGSDDDTQYVDAQLEFMKLLMQDIKNNYKDEITFDQLINGAYEGIFDALDPHSVYYATDEEKQDFVETVNGVFSGIGVSLDTTSGKCLVVAPIAGTPADRAGILPGDVIVQIDGKDVRGVSGDDIVSMLRGEEGTRVVVGIDRAGHDGVIRFTLTREKIKMSSVSGKMLDDRIGYIKIDSFDSDTDNEFKAQKLTLINKGMKYLVLDLRNNPGGYILVAANIANQLMPEGPIVHFEQQGEIIDTIDATGSGLTDMPIAVLINGGSASSSEILAGALQDSGAAFLVGTQSYGKGTAQRVVELDNGAAMKLSEYYFLTPDKRKIDQVGLTPDYVIDNKLGSESDTTAMIEEAASFAPMSETVKPTGGDTGLNVYGAQQRLDFLGYELAVSGTMDPKTVSAVYQFQKTSGLYAYGVLDLTTCNKINEAVHEYISDFALGQGDPQLDKAVEILKQK